MEAVCGISKRDFVRSFRLRLCCLHRSGRDFRRSGRFRLRGEDRHNGRPCQHNGQNGQIDWDLLCFHDCLDPFFRRGLSKSAAERMRLRLPRGKLQKCQRVRFTPVPAEIAERQGVAGQLQIPVGQQDHPPADRVPPVHAQTQGKQELLQAVPAADMRKFMGQDHPQRLPSASRSAGSRTTGRRTP